MIRRFGLLFVLALLLWPAAALAQDATNNSDDDVLIRVNNSVVVAADQTIDVVMVINDDATIDGTINEVLIVVKGTATINGRVDGDLVVARGDLILGPNAVVDDIHLYDSSLVRDPAATVRGDITEDSEFKWSWWGSALVSFGVWVGVTIVVLVAGLLFALFGPKQLLALGETARTQVPTSILAAIVVMVGLPILAFAILFTIIGIPLSLAIFFMLLPLLWLIGYIVMGAVIGRWLLARMAQVPGVVLATLLGLLVLQLIGLVPVIGGTIAALAGVYGAGVVVYHLFKGRRNQSDSLGSSGAVTAPATPN